MDNRRMGEIALLILKEGISSAGGLIITNDIVASAATDLEETRIKLEISDDVWQDFLRSLAIETMQAQEQKLAIVLSESVAEDVKAEANDVASPTSSDGAASESGAVAEVAEEQSSDQVQSAEVQGAGDDASPAEAGEMIEAGANTEVGAEVPESVVSEVGGALSPADAGGETEIVSDVEAVSQSVSEGSAEVAVSVVDAGAAEPAQVGEEAVVASVDGSVVSEAPQEDSDADSAQPVQQSAEASVEVEPPNPA